jgi:SOS-response transcriptional repressor LexA
MNINQQKILDLAKKKDISNMSLTDIAKELDIDHLYKVKYHLEQLKKKNLIYIDSDKKTQKVAEPKSFLLDKILSIPIVGSANCGPAMQLAQESVQGYLKISKRVIEFSQVGNLIALKAVGESLNKAKIIGESVDDGDYLVVDCARQPENNDYVLSIIDGAANFKKFYKDEKREEIHLISESTLNIPPIILHQDDINTSGYLVNGVVVRVVKN